MIGSDWSWCSALCPDFSRLLRPLLPTAFRYIASQRCLPKAGPQSSQGKARHFRSIYWLHLHLRAPDDCWVNVTWPARPACSHSGALRLDASYAVSVRPAGALHTASFPPRLTAVAVCCSARVPSHQGPRGLSPPSDFLVRFRSPVTMTKGLASRPKGIHAMPGIPKKAPGLLRGHITHYAYSLINQGG